MWGIVVGLHLLQPEGRAGCQFPLWVGVCDDSDAQPLRRLREWVQVVLCLSLCGEGLYVPWLPKNFGHPEMRLTCSLEIIWHILEHFAPPSICSWL